MHVYGIAILSDSRMTLNEFLNNKQMLVSSVLNTTNFTILGVGLLVLKVLAVETPYTAEV